MERTSEFNRKRTSFGRIGQMSRVFDNGSGDQRSISGRVIPKT